MIQCSELVFEFHAEIAARITDLTESLLGVWILKYSFARRISSEFSPRDGHWVCKVSWDILSLLDSLIDRCDTSQTWLAKPVAFLTKGVHRWLLFSVVHTEVAHLAAHVD